MLARAIIKSGILVLVAALSGCGGDVVGTYKQEGKEREITLSKDGKMFFPSGDVATYAVDGNMIVVGSWAGGAKGEVSGSKLIFPKGDGIVSGSLSGTWIKK